METILVIWFICIILAMIMAKARGRSIILAMFAGLIFTVWSLLYYLLVGDTTELRAKKTYRIEKALSKK